MGPRGGGHSVTEDLPNVYAVGFIAQQQKARKEKEEKYGGIYMEESKICCLVKSSHPQ